MVQRSELGTRTAKGRDSVLGPGTEILQTMEPPPKRKITRKERVVTVQQEEHRKGSSDRGRLGRPHWLSRAGRRQAAHQAPSGWSVPGSVAR